MRRERCTCGAADDATPHHEPFCAIRGGPTDRPTSWWRIKPLDPETDPWKEYLR